MLSPFSFLNYPSKHSVVPKMPFPRGTRPPPSGLFVNGHSIPLHEELKIVVNFPDKFLLAVALTPHSKNNRE